MNTASTTRLATLKIEKVLKGSEGWGAWRVLVLDWMKMHRVGGFVDPLHPYSLKPVAAAAVVVGSGTAAVITSIAISDGDVENWEHVDHQILATMWRLVDKNVNSRIWSPWAA